MDGGSGVVVVGAGVVGSFKDYVRIRSHSFDIT